MLGDPTASRVAIRREGVRREILAAAWAQAHEVGLVALTLRDVARAVGMQAPSLYSHFASKHAIYDAMYAEAWTTYEAHAAGLLEDLPSEPRAAVQRIARTFFDFAVADHPRHQLMNQKVIPGFEPTPESYEPAVRVLTRARSLFEGLGLEDPDAFDIWIALVGGLVDQHFANDPGGSRFSRLLERAVDMWADAVDLPRTPHAPGAPAPTPDRASSRKVPSS